MYFQWNASLYWRIFTRDSKKETSVMDGPLIWFISIYCTSTTWYIVWITIFVYSLSLQISTLLSQENLGVWMKNVRSSGYSPRRHHTKRPAGQWAFELWMYAGYKIAFLCNQKSRTSTYDVIMAHIICVCSYAFVSESMTLHSVNI